MRVRHVVGHLWRFELRRLRVPLLAIAVLELLRLAADEFGARHVQGMFYDPNAARDIVRGLDWVILGTTWLVTAIVVQREHPRDETAYLWTRPVSRLAVGAAKLLALLTLFAAVPIVLAIARLSAYHAPVGAVGAAVVQLVVLAGARVLPAWWIAVTARTLPGFFGLGTAMIILLVLVADAGILVYIEPYGPSDLIRHYEAAEHRIDWQGVRAHGWVAGLVVTACAAAASLTPYQSRGRWVVVAAALGLGLAVRGQPTADDAGTVPAAPADAIRTSIRVARNHVYAETVRNGDAGVSPDEPSPVHGGLDTPALPSDYGVAFRSKSLTFDDVRITRTAWQACCAGFGSAGVLPRTTAFLWPLSENHRRAAGAWWFEAPRRALVQRLGTRVAIAGRVEARVHHHRQVGILPIRAGVAFTGAEYRVEVVDVRHRPTHLEVDLRVTSFPQWTRWSAAGMQIYAVDRGRTRADHVCCPPPWFMAVQSGRAQRWPSIRDPWVSALLTRAWPVEGGPEWLRDAEFFVVETHPAGRMDVAFGSSDVFVADRRPD